MKRKSSGAQGDPKLPGAQTLIADYVAEALMMHTHECVARQAAVAYLRQRGLTEAQYLINWAAGAYDG